MTAAVLSIGTELTRGELINSNATWLAEQLSGLGFEILELATVGDDRPRIEDAIRRLARSARVVVVTGGLGPTTDDVTTECVVAVVGARLKRDEESLQAIRSRWAARSRAMPPSNEKQADFPVGAAILPNAAGTAPGFALTIGEARFFFLPGVPSEMEQMFSVAVTPEVAALAPRTTYQIHIRTFGLPESEVGERLAGLEVPDSGVTLGYRASFPEIEVKVHARGTDTSDARNKAEAVATQVRQRLGSTVFGDRDTTFAAAVGRKLRDRGLTLAIAESCTGGMVGSMVTSVPGSSNYLLLDAVAYSNAAKTQVLGVSEDILRAHGAVSSEAAAAMAQGALRISGADIAVSVTGIAGPGGATDERPVGTAWFGLARKGGATATRLRRLHGDRDHIRTLASYIALSMVADAADAGDAPHRMLYARER